MHACLALALALPMAPAHHPLETLRDRRPLLVFAPSAEDPRFLQQEQTAQTHSAELADRQVILIPVLERDSPGRLRGPLAPLSNPEEQHWMRSRYHVQPGDFTVILLGKDGGEKLRTHAPLSFKDLTETIDAMPMRQDEMRRQKQAAAPPK